MTDDDHSWHDQAACRDTDPDVFYPTGQKGPLATAATFRALVICRDCPVRAQCRDYALRNEEWGIWGGMSEQELRETRRTCGTSAGYRRHLDARTEPCASCRAAHASRRRQWVERTQLGEAS